MRELLHAAKEAAFALESVAHLQGKERELLPIAERLRAEIARHENAPIRLSDHRKTEDEQLLADRSQATNAKERDANVTLGKRRRAMGFPKRVEDNHLAIDEKCACGALRSQHEDTVQLGHGGIAHRCPKFTFNGWVLA